MNKFLQDKVVNNVEDLNQFVDINYEQRCYVAYLRAKFTQKGIFSKEVQQQDEKLKFFDFTAKSTELTQFCQQYKQKQFDGFIEHVRDSDSFYLML